MKDSNIQWTDATWNIARGCTKVDEDCKFCYMYRDSFENTRYNPLEVVRTKTVFNFPLKYKETHSKVWPGLPLIFTSSLTDVFHPAIDNYRGEMWDICRKTNHLIKQILTKRPERIVDHLPDFWDEIKEYIWLGTSAGSQSAEMRMLILLTLKQIAPTLFLSLEPLHGPVVIPHVKQFQWVIVGGESGNENGKYRYRPCKLDWIEDIVLQCIEANVPVFVKQLGTHLAKELKMSDRHGGNINEFPEHLRLRQFPPMKGPWMQSFKIR